MAKTPLGKLDVALKKALSEYAEDVNKDVKALTSVFAKKGARAVKQAAQSTFDGTRYATGWTSTIETGRLSSHGTIYNAKTPGLPHLLEHGHANRRGGRTYPPVPGHEHIAPVEEKLTEEFLKAVEDAI